jgi:hypothetical protein
MPNLLIRDVPDRVLAAIDANARRLGLSRSEYLRRQLAREAGVNGGDADAVTVDELSQFASTFADLGDPDVMSRAWQ